MSASSHRLMNAKPYKYVYADASARAAASGFLPEDVGYLALQLDTQIMYMLIDDSPVTWQALTPSVLPPTGTAGGVLSGSYPNPGFAADMATQAELDAHISDSSAAHAAGAIGVTPAGGIASTDVQSALAELDMEKAATSHTHTASQITDFTEASQDVVGALVTGAGGSYDDAAGTITLPGGDPSGAIHAATSKATPVDADELGLGDSAASFGLKKLTWANLKATVKAYFDTLYAAIAHTHPDTTLGGDAMIPSMLLHRDRPVTSGLTEASRWTRAGTILSPVQTFEATAVQEPFVIVEDGLIKMWYTGGWAAAALGYATCPITADPTVSGNWNKHTGAIFGGGASGRGGQVCHHGIAHIGNLYYCWYADASVGSDLRYATSTDGIAWTDGGVAIAHNQVAWSSEWANPHVWQEDGAWHMIVEGRDPTLTTWLLARATSSDGLTWTIQGSGPLTTLQVGTGAAYSGMWLPPTPRRDGRYHGWYHACTVTNSSLPTNIYHAYSDDLITWAVVGGAPVLTHTGSSPEVDQVADPVVIELGGTTYLFYDALDNPSSASVIRVATIDATLAQVIDGIDPAASGGGGGGGAGELGHARITSAFTSAASASGQDVTGMAATVTVGTRPIKVTVSIPLVDTPGNGAATRPAFSLLDVTAGSEVGACYAYVPNGTLGSGISFVARLNPGAGSRTYKVQVFPDGNVATRAYCNATEPALLLIEEL